jgi:hypothetical protein
MAEQSAPKSETVAERIVEVPLAAGKVLVIGVETAGRDIEKGAIEGGTAVVDASKIVAGDLAQVGRQLGRDVRLVVAHASDALQPSPFHVPAPATAPAQVVSAPVAATVPATVATTSVAAAPVV